MKTVKTLAWRSLENAALAISTAAQSALRIKDSTSGEEFRNILADRVVAYAFIADSSGKILFHTNPGLKGNIIKGFSVANELKPAGRRIILGTGIEAYEYIFPLERPKSSPEYLVLVMNSAETYGLIAKAGRIWIISGTVILMLLIAAILFERLATRSMKLETEIQRQRELGMIGQMTSVLAHEIRNTLGSLKGYAQWADENTGDADSKKPALAFIIDGAKRIETLVNELLLFSREEAYRSERFELKGFIDELASETLHSWKGVYDSSVDNNIVVSADREKLKRALINVIINAVQAAPDNGFIRISADIKGNLAEIMIKDNGKGLDDGDLEKLFTPFYTTKASGTGLGLAYAKKVITAMGGTIMLRNRPDKKGAVAAILIPGGKEA